MRMLNVDRRGGEQGTRGRTGDVAPGPRPGEGLHHHHRDAGEGGKEGQGVLKQDKLLTSVYFVFYFDICSLLTCTTLTTKKYHTYKKFKGFWLPQELKVLHSSTFCLRSSSCSHSSLRSPSLRTLTIFHRPVRA